MTGGVIHVPQVDFLNPGRLLSLGRFAVANKKQKAIMLIVLDNLQRKTWCVGVENVAQFSTSFIHGGRRKAGVELTRNKRLSY